MRRRSRAHFGHFRWPIRGTCLARFNAEFSPNALHAFQTSRYSGRYPAMIVRVALLTAVVSVAGAIPSFADARNDAKSQVEFGINVAQRGLWREAIYRWEKA